MKLVSRDSKSFVRDESGLRTASAGFILLAGGMWLVLLLGVVLMCLKRYLPASVIILLVGVFYIYSETQINYYECVRYDFKPDSIIYSYRLNSGLMGSNCKGYITIKDISSVKRSGKYAVVRGNIDKKAPLRKHKSMRKVKLLINFGNDTDKLLEALNNSIKEV